MNTSIFNPMARFSFVVIMLALLTSCSSMRWDPADHYVSLERVSPEYIEISQVFMHKAEKGITVYGELSPRRITQEIPPGHVHISLVAQDGATMFEENVSYYRMGKPLKRPQRYSFSATIPIAPPEGSTIRLRFEGAP